jgi:Fur family peroxide stress response transcriptional regulator
MDSAVRHSKKRDAIYAALYESRSHPAADQLYSMLKPYWPDLSLGTVYRNLSRFKEEGRAVVVGVVNGQERFDGNVKPHNHLFCDCGAVVDIDDLELGENLDEKASQISGCKITSHEIVFHGLCPLCNNINSNNEMEEF